MLYRLPELLAADPAQPVYIAEGEKDIDNLALLGFTATTNVGGAAKWKPEYGEALKGRTVYILPDNDEPGEKHLVTVGRALTGIAEAVHVLRLPDLPPKGDVSDWIAAGGTAEQLRLLTASAPIYIPPPDDGDIFAGKAEVPPMEIKPTVTTRTKPRAAATGNPLQNLLGTLNPTKTKSGWQARCPAHDDRKSSLSIAQRADGGLLLHCHAGCDTERVVSCMGMEMKDLFPPQEEDYSAAAKYQPATEAEIVALLGDDEQPENEEHDDDLRHYEKRTAEIHRDQLPATITSIMDDFAAKLHRPADMHIMFAAIWAATVVIGKRIQFVNHGPRYYCNQFCVLLGDSGKNKSGAAGTVIDTANQIVNVVESTATTMPAFFLRYGDKVNPKENPNAIRETIAKHRQELDGINIVIDEFRSWITEMIPPLQAVQYGQRFCKMIENRPLETETAQRGISLIGDPCISLLGFSQADPWNEEMRSAAYQTGGISARIVPVNTLAIELTGYTSLPVAEGAAVGGAIDHQATIGGISNG